MRIAFIFTYPRLVPSDGVYAQAMSWAKGLETLGHSVFLIDFWKNYDWRTFDVLLFFSYNQYLRECIQWLSRINKNIIVAPIIDPNASLWVYKVYARWGNDMLRLTNSYHDLYRCKNDIKLFLARSDYEKKVVSKILRVNPEKCKVVPISYSIDKKDINKEKEDFCLHISLLCDERKNVFRLIQAAKKYKFKLVLGGKLRNKDEENLLQSWMKDNEYVSYLGYLSNDSMLDLYSRARVFALPSTKEGVGIVAMNAALMGCDIVLTDIDGPKEYYNGLVNLVDPYSIDEIGCGVVDFMKGKTFQPQLQNYVSEHYNVEAVSVLLENAIASIL